MTWRVSNRTRLTLLALIVIVGFALRVWGIGWGLHDANISRRPHPDEWAIFYLFQWFGSTHSLNPCPSYPHQCFFDWGMAFPYVAYGAHFLIAPFLGLIPASAYGSQADLGFVRNVLEARLVSSILSTLTILVVYKLAGKAYGDGVGLVAALLVALAGLPIQLAHFGTPDSTTGLLMSLALLSFVTALQSPTRWHFIVAGIAIGAATGSEFHMALLAMPLLATWLLAPRREPQWLLVASIAGAVTFLILNPYILADLPAFLSALSHTLRIRTVDSQLQYGDRWAAYGPAWLYVVRYPLGYGVGFALAVWMLLGIGWATVRHRPADLILLSWTLSYFLLVTIEPAKFMRYSAPLILPLAIFAARLAVDAVSRGRVMRTTFTALGVFAILYSAAYDSAYAGLFASPDPRAVSGAWVASHATPATPVAFEELPDGLLNLPYFLGSSVRPCFAQFHFPRLRPVEFVMLDGYTPEEQPASALSTIARFKNALASDSQFRLVEQVHDVPTFLGIQFPIDGSPHDWRYPSHVISVYRNLTPTAGPSKYCFSNLDAAARALYIPPALRRK